MQYPDCANEFCLYGESRNDVPAYVVEAKTQDDISAGIKFAKKHKIQVSIKSSGHNESGGSTYKGSLLIWLGKFPLDNEIKTNYTDDCGTDHGSVVAVNAGQSFVSIAQAVGDRGHFVSGNEATVCASGGWMLGVGLSFTSRGYGVGVDNVVDFDVVLANGDVVRADACTNPDLFWALRGGGGGQFGVVSHMHYKLHPVSEVVLVDFAMWAYPLGPEHVISLMTWFHTTAPTVDTRWGGYWSAGSLFIFFVGTLEEATSTLIAEFDRFFDEDFPELEGMPRPSDTVKVYPYWGAGVPDFIIPGGARNVTEQSHFKYIPLDFVVNNSTAFLDLILEFAGDGSLGIINYWLGGKVNDVPVDATAVHPSTRSAHTLLFVTSIESAKKLHERFDSGTSKNHHGALEPNWKENLWGSNYERLLEIKKKYDPDMLFNVYKGVGYAGPEIDIYNYEEYLQNMTIGGETVETTMCPELTEPTPAPSGAMVAYDTLWLFGVVGFLFVVAL